MTIDTVCPSSIPDKETLANSDVALTLSEPTFTTAETAFLNV